MISFLFILSTFTQVALSEVKSDKCTNSYYLDWNDCNFSYDTETGVLTVGGTSFSMDLSRPNWETYKNDIKKLVVKDGIKSIPRDYFDPLNNLEEIELPASLEEIGGKAFATTKQLVKIVIKGNGLKIIGGSAFSYCHSLPSFYFPTSLTYIGEKGFYNCVQLQEVVLPEGFQELGNNAFETSRRLTKVVLPSTIQKIGYKAFFETNINDITFMGTSQPSTCDEIHLVEGTKVKVPEDYNGDKFCGQPVEKIKLPPVECGDFTTQKGDSSNIYPCTCVGFAYSSENTNVCQCDESYYSDANKTVCEVVGFCGNGCKGEWIEGEQKLKIAGDGAIVKNDQFLMNKDKIVYLEIHREITAIENEMFKGFSSLKEVEIAESVKKIGDNAFKDCTNLKKVNFMGHEEPTVCSKIAFDESVLIHVPSYYNGQEFCGRKVYVDGTSSVMILVALIIMMILF